MGLRPLACWDYGFESCRRYECLSLVSVLCSQVELPVTCRSLARSSPTECGVSECDREISTMRRSRPTRVVDLPKKNTHTHTSARVNADFFHGSWVVQGGSNMTGTDLCVNKPHCAAAVRP